MKNVSSISIDSKYERSKQKQECKMKQMLTVFYFSSRLAARVRNVQANWQHQYPDTALRERSVTNNLIQIDYWIKSFLLLFPYKLICFLRFTFLNLSLLKISSKNQKYILTLWKIIIKINECKKQRIKKIDTVRI